MRVGSKAIHEFAYLIGKLSGHNARIEASAHKINTVTTFLGNKIRFDVVDDLCWLFGLQNFSVTSDFSQETHILPLCIRGRE